MVLDYIVSVWLYRLYPLFLLWGTRFICESCQL